MGRMQKRFIRMLRTNFLKRPFFRSSSKKGGYDSLRKCFKFTKENSSSLGIVYRPIVKVELRDANGEPFELSVLVDSGADISIFSRRIGDIMGINVEKGEEKIFRGTGYRNC